MGASVPNELTEILERKPILWLGAGAGCHADPGLPTLRELAQRLVAQRRLPDFWLKLDPYETFARYTGERHGNQNDLSAFLEAEIRRDGKSARPGALHTHLARLAAAGAFHAVIDTNYDLLLKRSMDETGASFTHVVLEKNLHLPQVGCTYLSLHGSHDDWRAVVLSPQSFELWEDRYHFLQAQLDVLLFQHPVLFVGCSMTDPRLLDWLVRNESRKDELKLWRALVGDGAIGSLAKAKHREHPVGELLKGVVNLLEVPSYDKLPQWFGELANRHTDAAPGARRKTTTDIVAPPSQSEGRRERVSELSTNALELYRDAILGLAPTTEVRNFYVDPACALIPTNQQGRVRIEPDRRIAEPLSEPSLYGFVQRWMERPPPSLALLGDMGSGKTLFCHHIWLDTLTSYLADPKERRIPVLVNLRDYNESQTIWAFVAQSLCGLAVAFRNVRNLESVLKDLNSRRRLLLICDGLDELPQKGSSRQRASDLLNKLKEAANNSGKLIVTCRTTYFRSRLEEGEAFLSGDMEVAYVAEFDDQRIKKALELRLQRFPKGPKPPWEPTWNLIRSNRALLQLARQPLLLSLIVEIQDKLPLGPKATYSEVFKRFTDALFERDAIKGTAAVTTAFRKDVVSALAWATFQSQQTLTTDFQFRKEIAEAAARSRAKAHPSVLEADVRMSSFLQPYDADGNLQFKHRSLMEYLVSETIASRLDVDVSVLDGRPIYYEIIRFVEQRIPRRERESVKAVLVSTMHDHNSTEAVRVNSARLLGAFVAEGASVVPELTRLADSPMVPTAVRRDALRSIYRLLYGEVADLASGVSARAVWVYARTTDPEVPHEVRTSPILIALRRGPSARGDSERAAIRQRREGLVRELCWNLLANEGTSSEIRVNAAFGLVCCVDPSSTTRVEEQISREQDPYVCFNLISALAALNQTLAQSVFERVKAQWAEPAMLERMLGNLRIARPARSKDNR